MRRKKKILIFAAALSMLLGGCSIGGRQVVLTDRFDSQEVFRIGDGVCRLTEAKIYLANYQNIYGKSYGIDLWQQKFKQKELERYIKEIALSEMARIACMELLAKNQEITLTEEEKQGLKEAAETYYQSLSGPELAYTGAQESDIVSMYEDYALASKVYQSLTRGINDEVSDDEARIMEATVIYVKEKETADVIAKKLGEGEDFAAIAGSYSQKPAVERAFGRGELPKEAEDAAFELDNDEVSACIAAEDGYYFIKCSEKFNEELTNANKSNIVRAREKAAFEDVYEAFVSGLSSELNHEAWDGISLVTDGSITTDTFFDAIGGAMK